MRSIITFSLFILLALAFSTQSILAQSSSSKRYAGTINNSLDIQMSLQRDGNNLTGNYFYKKIGRSIKLTGTIDNQNVVINEFDEKGTNTGTFTGTISKDGNEIKGSWKKTGGT